MPNRRTKGNGAHAQELALNSRSKRLLAHLPAQVPTCKVDVDLFAAQRVLQDLVGTQVVRVSGLVHALLQALPPRAAMAAPRHVPGEAVERKRSR